EERPASAVDVLRMLRGDASAPLARPVLPRLGDDAPVRALAAAGRAKRSVDLVGPPGSGRTRCLEDVRDALERSGVRAIATVPAPRPFASLEALVGPLDEQRSRRLEDVVASVEERFRAALASGTVLLVDDADRIDSWTAGVIARCRSAGSVLRALPAGEAPSA